MNRELDSFDMFVDDIITSDENLLKGELDILLMQYVFSSLELENLKNIDLDSKDLKTDSKDILPKLHGALIKNEQDIQLFEQLAFMSRGNR